MEDDTEDEDESEGRVDGDIEMKDGNGNDNEKRKLGLRVVLISFIPCFISLIPGGITLNGVCSVIAFYDYINYGKIKHVLQLGFVIIGGGYYFYNMKKSFKVHEDVDFATSSEMESLVGLEVGEKIQATYQNFDSSAGEELKDGASLMLVSDKRIYFSYVENGEWSFMRKNLNEIVKMAIVGDGNNEYKSYLKLVFSDETRIVLALEDFEKMTSNKLLFLKKFLDVLDAVALGTVDEKISSRRRISVGQGTKSVDSQQKENRETRSIDLSKDLLDKLKNATPVESGRVLEL